MTTSITAPAAPLAVGDIAARMVARTGIPVLLLATHPNQPTVTAGIDGHPRRYTSTTATYPQGLRTEVHAPGGPDPDQLVRRALPGAPRTSTAYLATPGRMTLGVETRHDGLLARAGTWRGWTLLTVTEDQNYAGPLPTLRVIGADSLPEGQPGRPYLPQDTA
ncbi:hypothetical protein OG196_14325 [Kitasatospora purpeofusca]|uniref:hypothetical protein n=1 Tax=Kitasatospora purpeofusca TaxID=67352 RepID=UPI002E0DB703|nr:hypothetical protein OG196_14325 [Kitasatospora purpeofusca]